MELAELGKIAAAAVLKATHYDGEIGLRVDTREAGQAILDALRIRVNDPASGVWELEPKIKSSGAGTSHYHIDMAAEHGSSYLVLDLIREIRPKGEA